MCVCLCMQSLGEIRPMGQLGFGKGNNNNDQNCVLVQISTDVNE